MVRFDVVVSDHILGAKRMYVPSNAHRLPLKLAYRVTVKDLKLDKASAWEKQVWFTFGEFGNTAAVTSSPS